MIEIKTDEQKRTNERFLVRKWKCGCDGKNYELFEIRVSRRNEQIDTSAANEKK